MRFLSLVGNSFGCSASGERLVSAARDGDIQEAKALLEYNPRLAKYSTFGGRNSPLHHSAAQGHHEIVSLLIESGVDIDLRNHRGQTALMQACQYGHWEVMLTLVLFKANIHKKDDLNGGTALHLAALNGHSRCIRILLVDYIPSIPDFYKLIKKRSRRIDEFVSTSNEGNSLYEIINRPADGGLTALHMAALNGHVDSLHLLLDLGASVNKVTVEDGTTIDLIGAGSTPLHYAAYGGNPQCCQILIARGANITARNAKGWNPLAVARSWHRDWLEEVLSTPPQDGPTTLLSPYLCRPLISVVKIARECGWSDDSPLNSADPCAVCLENKCTVAASGCLHELCTRCALYLCSTSNTSSSPNGPPGSIPCPLCRAGIVSFKKLASTKPPLQTSKSSSSLSCCSCSSMAGGSNRTALETTPLCKPKLSSRSLRSQKFPSFKLKTNLCMQGLDTIPSLIRRSTERPSLRAQLAKYSRSSFRWSNSHSKSRRSWFCSLNPSVETPS
ncbi:E3 ubiquitin-protein ligase XBAT32 [Cynara cardunculus var. scolymus]|uniref:E3 ubiquitin-protein ligase XBAT32 n=1 Tax=Cynara cardunculus var. scolymus TaxID=59895 RepID=UPI000D629AFC|nr:E3 ubiquitin-protein ligase XBAT32 [Cynara cardunculus var. scolymus]XP_024967100.1 E3 ubiquitin-protein ligase XBAT32 [Cynara cardunculus var. scolymus]